MSYQVKLEVFEGPFDLLLHLIARRQVDVTEIDLADITADFVSHLGDGIEELDLDTATRFLVVAATLVELKAARLLPVEQREELEDLLGDARDRLYARLLEYRAFRDVARILEHRLHHHETTLAREVPLEGWLQRLVPTTPLPIDAVGLARLAAAALAPEPEAEVDLSHIRRSYLTIREAALQVLGRLEEPGARAAFTELSADRERGDRVVLFLALLELFKLGQVDLEQPEPAAPLLVARRAGGLDLDALVEDEPEPTDAEAPGVDVESPGVDVEVPGVDVEEPAADPVKVAP
ncbi:MAG: segregation and condensation protein A [Nitriliruptoraceae bacterium]